MRLGEMAAPRRIIKVCQSQMNKGKLFVVLETQKLSKSAMPLKEIKDAPQTKAGSKTTNKTARNLNVATVGTSWLLLKDLAAAVSANNDQKVIETKYECIPFDLPEGKADFESILSELQQKNSPAPERLESEESPAVVNSAQPQLTKKAS